MELHEILLADYRRSKGWNNVPIEVRRCLTINNIQLKWYNVKEAVAIVYGKHSDDPIVMILDLGADRYAYVLSYTYRSGIVIKLADSVEKAAQCAFDSFMISGYNDGYTELLNQLDVYHAAKHNSLNINNQPVTLNKLNTTTKTAYVSGSFLDDSRSDKATPSGAYIKFGDGVQSRQPTPVAPSAVPTPVSQVVAPYPPMYRGVKQETLNQSTGLNKNNSAFSVEPVEGLHLLLHISSDIKGVNEDDILNGLTELLKHIHTLAHDSRMGL